MRGASQGHKRLHFERPGRLLIGRGLILRGFLQRGSRSFEQENTEPARACTQHIPEHSSLLQVQHLRAGGRAGVHGNE
eukprot:1160820-Pelagomonas_calceolata.AAC.3